MATVTIARDSKNRNMPLYSGHPEMLPFKAGRRTEANRDDLPFETVSMSEIKTVNETDGNYSIVLNTDDAIEIPIAMNQLLTNALAEFGLPYDKEEYEANLAREQNADE